MASITISVPDALRKWLERRALAAGYGSAGDYLGELIQREREDHDAKATIVTQLERGEESGISPRRAPDILAALRREIGGTDR